jgi:hypothetical protein
MRAVVAALVAVILLFSSCLVPSVYKKFARVSRARETYEACRDANGSAADSACGAEKARYELELRRYEEAARKAWDCDPAQPECSPDSL